MIKKQLSNTTTHRLDTPDIIKTSSYFLTLNKLCFYQCLAKPSKLLKTVNIKFMLTKIQLEVNIEKNSNLLRL